MSFQRELSLKSLRSSAFIFGPRMTGKTTLLRSVECDAYINLLDPEIELSYKASPRIFGEVLQALPLGALVILDEIQRIPLLLDYVQMGMEERKQRFLLSGSSARKLKRGSANLLGGRALDLKMHPLTVFEIGKAFNLAKALEFGTLPRICEFVLEGSEEADREARLLLKSYITTYLKEEIQAEALTRNVGAFQRFLAIAGQSNASIIEFANISRECSVPMSTVKEYYSILEDTLIGNFLWPYDRSERKKARPKFYFFDCGVIRALQNRLGDPPTPQEKGFLFETWFFGELIKIRDNLQRDHEFHLWRKGNHEIDFLVTKGGKALAAFECKSGQADVSQSVIDSFRKEFPRLPLWVVSFSDERSRKKEQGVEIHSWKKALDFYRNL